MKERPSKLDAHAELLTEWFGVEKVTLAEARERLESQHGCSVSVNRLSLWWAHQQQVRMQDKLLSDIATGARFNRQLERQLDANPPPELQTLMQLVKTLIAQLAVSGQSDPDTLRLVGSLTSLVLDDRRATGSFRIKEQELALKERRIVLLERKAAERDQAADVVNSALSPEEKTARIKQIFGMG